MIKDYKEMTLDEVFVEDVLDDLYELNGIYGLVEVPQCVGDWIEKAKEECYSILGAINKAPKGEVLDWISSGNIDEFAKAWVNGYKIKVDKKYTVRVVETEQVLYKSKAGLKFINNYYEKSKHKYEFTENELKSHNMSYVFNNKGFKVEEVEND